MKLLAIICLILFISTPLGSSAQQSTTEPKDIPIALTKKDKFVVKLMKVINKTGKKIPGLVELNSFDIDKKLFVFRNSQKKLKKIPVGDIKEIVFHRVLQGVLTGKPPSFRMSVMRGAERSFELAYAGVKIKKGYFYLGPEEIANYFNDFDTLKAIDVEWSDKFNEFWMRKEKESPDLFSANFAFEDGYWVLSRKMASEYCSACLKLEILNIQPNPKKETLIIRCKDVLYDIYHD